MTFDHLYGNEKLIQRLRVSIASGSVGHAYIFEAGADVDKLLFAMCFIKALLCKNGGCESCVTCRKIDDGNHEDIHVVSADGASVKDGQIEDLQAELRKKPFGSRNIAVISDADTMTQYAQNRLLKTLEEPAPGTVIILLVENIENMLPTIRSRCMSYRLEDSGITDPEAEGLARRIEEMIYEEQPFYILKDELEKLAKDREMSRKVLDCLEKIYAGHLLSGDLRYKDQKVYDAVEAIEEAAGKIRKNMNTAYALKAMLLKIGG